MDDIAEPACGVSQGQERGALPDAEFCEVAGDGLAGFREFADVLE